MATSTITGTITGPTGTAVAGARIVCRLMPTAGFRSADGSEVARAVETTTNASGVYTLVLEENAGITPANTYYELTEYIPAAQGGTRVWNIQVGASDQTVLAALVSVLPDAEGSGYLTQAAADARYQALGGLSASTPAAETPDHAGTAGVSSSASRADHVHPITAAVAGSIQPDDAAAEGVATSFARSDHKHSIVAAAPSTVDPSGSASVSEGVATSFARSDHGHTLANTAWTTYTPVLTAASVNPTLGTGSIQAGRYVRNGRMISGVAHVQFGTAGTAAGTGEYRVSLPVTPRSTAVNNTVIGGGYLYDASANTLEQVIFVVNQSGLPIMFKNGTFTITEASPWAWAASDHISLHFTYEASA